MCAGKSSALPGLCVHWRAAMRPSIILTYLLCENIFSASDALSNGAASDHVMPRSLENVE